MWPAGVSVVALQTQGWLGVEPQGSGSSPRGWWYRVHRAPGCCLESESWVAGEVGVQMRRSPTGLLCASLPPVTCIPQRRPREGSPHFLLCSKRHLTNTSPSVAGGAWRWPEGWMVRPSCHLSPGPLVFTLLCALSLRAFSSLSTSWASQVCMCAQLRVSPLVT